MKLILSILIVLLLNIPVDSYGSDFPATKIYERLSPAVVLIKSTKTNGGGMIGAGSIISEDGLIVTNAHVVIDRERNKPYQNITVYLKPEVASDDIGDMLRKRLRTRLLKYSTTLDLALLQAEELPDNMPTIKLSNPREIKVGEEVVAIGHPEQGGFWSLTYGRISGEIPGFHGIKGKDMYQTDTSVNRGNSGGPLLDRRGFMVAINSNIARVGNGGLPITGVNFAIKSSVVKKWLDENGYMIAYGEESSIGTKKVEVKDSKIKARRVEAEDKSSQATAILKRDEAQDFKNKGKGQKKAAERSKGRIITPIRPYDYDAILKQAEEDLENMMDEMKKKIMKRRQHEM